MAGVRISGLTKYFGDVAAVDGIDLEIPDGSLTSFLGPSGCGKTTTLRMIAGLEKPTSGEIHIGDEMVYGAGRLVPPERRQIGMVFQSYAVWPHMKVFDNVAYPLQVRRLSRAHIRDRTMHALETVRMEALADRYPAQLSGGQQQRVALARAIVFEPVILLLDEPLSNLDAKLREDMRGEIRQLQQRLGVTTLYVTHDQQEALAISDQVAVMNNGRIVQLGTPRDIFERPADRFVAHFVGWTNFLPGVIADGNSVDVPGARLRCPVPDGAAAGDKVHVAIRPEDLRVGPSNGADENVIRGKVGSVMYMGKHVVCGVTVGDQTLQAHATVADSPAVGDDVELIIPANATIVLPS